MKQPFESLLDQVPFSFEPFEAGRSGPAPGEPRDLSDAPDLAQPEDETPWRALDHIAVTDMDPPVDDAIPEAPLPDWAAVPAMLEAGEIEHVASCGCSSCGAKEEHLTRVDTGTVEGTLEGNAAPTILGDMADFLLTGYWNTGYGDGSRSHNLTSSGIDANNGVLHYNLSGYGADADGVTAGRAFLIHEVFKLFEATLGIQFVETTSQDTNLVDFFFRDNDSGAYAGHSYYNSGAWGSTIHYAQINVAQSWSGGTSTYDDYTLQTIFHEVGHALGLGHQGSYNGSATYGIDNTFENDSWQASMMSYFSQSENSTINASYEFLQTPMAVDWMALDEIYGRQGFGVSNAFTGDTIYGFNTNITSAVSDIWANFANFAHRTASTIVDGSGIDTLDLSGYANNSVINLAPSDRGATAPSISSIGGRVGNLTIAEGTIIENAIGGAAGETFYGNAADNTLTGNGGNDLFFDSQGADTYLGGLGTDEVTFSGAFWSYSFELVGSFLQVIDAAIDLVESTVEWLNFSDQTLSFSAIVDGLAPNTAPVAGNDAYSVAEDVRLSVTDLLANDTDVDGDTLTVATVNGVAVDPGVEGTQITLASGALLTVYANGAFDYDQNGAFNSLDAGETATDSFTYSVSDGKGGADTATVYLTINGVREEDSDDPDAPALPPETPDPEIVLNAGREPGATPGTPVPPEDPGLVGDTGEDTGDDPDAPALPSETPDPEIVLNAGREPGATPGTPVPPEDPGLVGETGEDTGDDPDAPALPPETADPEIVLNTGRNAQAPLHGTDSEHVQNTGLQSVASPGGPVRFETSEPVGEVATDPVAPIEEASVQSSAETSPSSHEGRLNAQPGLADLFEFNDMSESSEASLAFDAHGVDGTPIRDLFSSHDVHDALVEEFLAATTQDGDNSLRSGSNTSTDDFVELDLFEHELLISSGRIMSEGDYLGL